MCMCALVPRAYDAATVGPLRLIHQQYLHPALYLPQTVCKHAATCTCKVLHAHASNHALTCMHAHGTAKAQATDVPLSHTHARARTHGLPGEALTSTHMEAGNVMLAVDKDAPHAPPPPEQERAQLALGSAPAAGAWAAVASG